MKYKRGMGFPPIKLTEEILQNLGFSKAGKCYLGRTKWRIKIPYYHFQIQVALGPYPRSNGNCGIVSLYEPAEDIISYTPKGRKKTIHSKQFERPIAWYVDTPERLRQIIVSLTQVNL